MGVRKRYLRRYKDEGDVDADEDGFDACVC
jgi:hypothetical protein